MALGGGGNLRKGPSRPSPNKQPQAARSGRGSPTPARAGVGVGGPALGAAGGVPATPAVAPSATPVLPGAMSGGGAPMSPGAGGSAMPTMRKGGKVKKTAKRR